MINIRLVCFSIIISGSLLMMLMYYPNLDIIFSTLFYTNKVGFIYKYNIIVQLIFLSVPIAVSLFLLLCIFGLLYLIIKYRTLNHRITIYIIYLVLCMALGPGLFVNFVLKEHAGRARPSQTIIFGGTKQFTPVLHCTNQCTHNCSFASGHAATIYCFGSFAYINIMRIRNKSINQLIYYKQDKIDKISQINFSTIYIIFLLLGSLVGLIRIVMGGHFLSDVVASCFVILVINHVLYLCLTKLSRNTLNKNNT